ncbi:fer-1-like protein 5 [Pseudophryne corroboree]|uniref:fer-1-like protein 5 n=1 Tax=Pseudophryne corroboree TaxID=495146 RepID=UPI003081C329
MMVTQYPRPQTSSCDTMLCLLVVSANIHLTKTKKADCKVVATFQGITKATSVVAKESNPVWNEALVWPLGETRVDSNSELYINVNGHDESHKITVFGSHIIPLKALLEDQGQTHNEVPLLNSKKQPTGNTITFRIVCTQEINTKDSPNEDVKQDQKISLQEKRDLTDEVQDLRVKVRIISGRQLFGSNIKPVVKVRVGKKVHITRVQRGSDPYFNEIFTQDFHQMPSEVFGELIHIQVLNSNAARNNSVIGVFKMDIGSVYDDTGHAILRKWLSLYEPDNVNSGVRGYLKVSLFVLVAGASAPVEDQNVPDDDDVESNLLTYSLVYTHVASVRVKILRGEDIPKKSHSLLTMFGTNLQLHSHTVNPFVKVTFAGKTLKTTVVHKNSNPVWDQMLVFPVQFPTMYEKIQLTVYDWDSIGQADALGSASLYISQMSVAAHESKTGENSGFLPTFGTSFLTLYGSPHEFLGAQNNQQSLNQGKEECVAYSGRLLLQVQTVVEDKPMLKVEAIPLSDVCRVECLTPRKKFVLAGILYSATMLPEVKDPIQFEMSMGNYGNKFYMTCEPFSSTTQYNHAVFDGNYYYYLPLYEAKPVLVVTTEWEDVTHRMHAFNVLQAMHKNLSKHIQFLQRESYPQSLDKSWRYRLQEMNALSGWTWSALENICSSTTLDQQLKSIRQLFLQDMMHSIEGLLKKKDPGLELLTQLDDWLQRLTEITYEPQISLPDVIIWMLYQDRRVAYAQVCPADILYGKTGMGIHCGRLQTIALKHFPAQKKPFTAPPAQLRLRLWLSLMSDARKMNRFFPGSLFACAETYENQAKWLGSWSTKTLGSYPPYSDITGIVSLEGFQPPEGWCWHGDWYLKPQKRVPLDKNSSHWEDVYENETRTLGGTWNPDQIPYTAVNGDEHPSMDKTVCAEGWHFVQDWKVEHTGSADCLGWEYGSGSSTPWAAEEETHHTHRRRHWRCKRERNVRPQVSDSVVTSFKELHSEAADPARWEYAPASEWKFNLKQTPTDVFRRRCWRRVMVPSDQSMSFAIFSQERSSELDLDKLDSNKETKDAPKGVLRYNNPLIYCLCTGRHLFQLRCYLFGARGLPSTDGSSSSGSNVHYLQSDESDDDQPHHEDVEEGELEEDMYVQVCFLQYSQHSEDFCRSTVWDQTLLFCDIIIYGKPKSVLKEPPYVTMEVFKKDQRGKDESLGCCSCLPIVHINVDTRIPPRLKWCPVRMEKTSSVELLTAFELLLDEKNGKLDSIPPLPTNENGNFNVPEGIRPTLVPMTLEVLAWGIRNIKTFHLRSVLSPSLLVECGGKCVQTRRIHNFKRNPNFPSEILHLLVDLPKEEYYMPPILLKVLDNRPFGYTPIVATCTVRDLKPYFIHPAKLQDVPPTQELPAGLNSPQDIKANVQKIPQYLEEEDEFDWWSKFFASIGDHGNSGDCTDKGQDLLVVYNTELESIPSFQGLKDFCQTFKLQRAKSYDDNDEDLSVVGEIKASIKICFTSEHKMLTPQQHYSLSAGPEKCLVRVYIIRGLDLPPHDLNGLCDPYIKISVGEKKMENRKNYIPCTLNPVFGTMFELSCVIPLEKDLKVSVYDYDLMSPDDKIGETVIDLENRLLSHFRANCGLPQTYRVSGPNTWRDQLLPSQLLNVTCSRREWASPTYTEDGQEVSVNNRKLCLSQFESTGCTHRQFGPPKERLSLYVLRTLGLVPEHVETRSLYNPVRPSLEQGKLQMWVDIFPMSLGAPGPPFNISPRIPKKYVLRCIVWQTQEVDLQDTNIFGERMSDIYVKGWIDGMECDKQCTDVHYRSLDGTGVFNWRFIFNFEYIDTEKMCVVQKKDHLWSLDKNAMYLPPKLIIQIWDNDKLSADDFLGVLELNLTHVPRPALFPENCTLNTMKGLETRRGFLRYLIPKVSSPCFFSLFKQKSLRGWWPCVPQNNSKPKLSGKIELTLILMTEKEAEENPAGKGQEEPNIKPKLNPPMRHDSSFLWFTSPIKSLRYIIWRRYRCRFLCALFFSLVLLLIGVFVYSSLSYLAMKLIKP